VTDGSPGGVSQVSSCPASLLAQRSYVLAKGFPERAGGPSSLAADRLPRRFVLMGGVYPEENCAAIVAMM